MAKKKSMSHRKFLAKCLFPKFENGKEISEIPMMVKHTVQYNQTKKLRGTRIDTSSVSNFCFANSICFNYTRK